MFASYKSQSTGNQGEANDIITFYITHKWSPCPGKGKTTWRPTNGQHTMKREVRPVPAFTDISESFKAPLPAELAWGRTIPALLACAILRQASSLNDCDAQGPSGAGGCHSHPSRPAGYQKGGCLERWWENKTTTRPPRACLLQVTHPGAPRSEEVQSSTGFQWNKILMEHLTLQCLRYHTAIVFNVMSGSMVMFC